MPRSGSLTLEQVAALRLAAQRVSGKGFTRPDQVVGWLGAVQAQDYLGALWAVGLRMGVAREADVERAVTERTIVRTWPMRGTLHFVAARDVRWMTDLLAPRVVSRAAGRLQSLGLDDAILARARRALEKALEGGPLARPAVYEALERARVGTAGQRGIHVLWRLAHDGVVCFGPRAGKQHTFVLLEAWVPRAERLSRDEALGELVVRYVSGHGPATTADFAWWSGLNLSDARRAVQVAGRRLRREVIDGREHWCDPRVARPRPADRPARSAQPEAFLLPAFDELLVGFADRSAVLDPGLSRRVNTGGGIFFPVMLSAGRVVGTWKRRLSRAGATFVPSPFAHLDAPTRAALHVAFSRYAAFLRPQQGR
ncbi:MAG: winged helix DNA-binding domain-containing protein [Polyangiaceae bacterium]